MEVTITKYKSQNRMLWDVLYQSNPSLSAYQSPEFMEQFFKTARLGKRRALLCSEVLLCTMAGTQMICPLALDKRKKEIFLIGDFSSVGYCDMIYGSDITDNQFDAIIGTLKSRYPGYKLIFNKINEHSLFFKYLHRHKRILSQSECVCIPVGSDYNAYYESLSKHTRQNIRTAYNRMKRDGKVYDFRIVQGTERLTERQKNEITRTYCNRMHDKFGNEELPYPIMYLVQRYFNPLVRSLYLLDAQFHALLYIDGELAAFLSGLSNSDGSRIVVPRLSMNSKFDFYDPGIVLLCETVEYLCRKHPNTELDLSRGNEKYKYAMGGTTHYNYSFVL